MAVNRADKEYLDAIWSWRVPGDDSEYEVANLRRFTNSAKQAWADIHGTHARKMGDRTKNEAARLLESAKFAKGALERQRRDYEEAKQEAATALRKSRERLQKAMNPPSDPGEAALFGEILRHIRSLPIGERVQLGFAASDGPTRDMRILHAAIAAPQALGVLPPEVHKELSERFLVNTAGQEFGKAHRLEAALGCAEAALQQLESHARNIIDFDTADAIGRSAAPAPIQPQEADA